MAQRRQGQYDALLGADTNPAFKLTLIAHGGFAAGRRTAVRIAAAVPLGRTLRGLGRTLRGILGLLRDAAVVVFWIGNCDDSLPPVAAEPIGGGCGDFIDGFGVFFLPRDRQHQ